MLFAGDLLIGEETLSKYDFLFLQDVEEYLKSLDIVKSLDFNNRKSQSAYECRHFA